MVSAETPFEAVQHNAHYRDSAGAEQPAPLFDTRFTLKVGAYDAAELSKQVCLFLFHVVVVEDDGLHVQLGDESVHPLIGGTNDCRPFLFLPADDADRRPQGLVTRSEVLHREVLVEHLRDDPVEHGFDVDGHSDSFPRRRGHDCALQGEHPQGWFKSVFVLMMVRVTVKEKVAYGFENALNYSRDDFDEDGHATTI
jgi:hypothetical protein